MYWMKTIILQLLWGYEHVTDYTQESDTYFICWHLYLSWHVLGVFPLKSAVKSTKNYLKKKKKSILLE